MTARRIPWFWIFLLVFALGCAAAVGFALDRLWQELIIYQKQHDAVQPETAIAAYLKNIENSRFETVLAESGFEPDAWNEDADYITWLKKLYGEKPTALICQPMNGSHEGEPGKPWAVLDGETRITTMYLEEYKNTDGDTAWSIRTPAVYNEGYAIDAAEYIEVSVNSAPIDPAESTGYAFIPAYLNLTDETPPPRMLQYRSPRLLGGTTFSAMGGNGEICRIDRDEALRSVMMTVQPFEADIVDFEIIMKDVATRYAEFISKDGTFTRFSQHLYRNTKFYDSVRTFDNSWYIDHQSHTIENWEFSNITKYSAGTFAGDISFEYVVMQGAKEHRFPSGYHMAFMEFDGGYKLISLDVK